ncbi:type III pantothenate kinase [Salmonirosea aquatica]|uniref:Type III pantothenate kinase n=1 Tax=Salmonirosea aquatica TaxID=2654236 RepID=A0A7C9BMK3_9BACT|nr:type III pantothenate kinase [Cytophagaceae bacterium SJW1-29]
MNIVVDSGNTYAKIGWFEGPELLRFETRLTFDQLIDAVRSSSVDNILFSSVGKDVEEFRRAIQPNAPVLNLDSQTPLPITKDYETPATLGADRIAAAVGAGYLFPNEDLVVIDMGTCITYDYLDQAARFQGGLISPGMRMRFKAMHTFTQRLPLVEPGPAPTLIGKNTRHAMLSGVMNGLVAEINGIMAAYRTQSPACRVVLCGGDVPFFESLLKPPIFVVPQLVLIGLNRILQHNVNLQNE